VTRQRNSPAARLSQPAICSGDHFARSFASTIVASRGVVASLHGLGRLRRFTAARSAAAAR
jgi:hypothetical protein